MALTDNIIDDYLDRDEEMVHGEQTRVEDIDIIDYFDDAN